MSDMYSDSESRYRNDPEFKAAVMMLREAAIRNGWTPGQTGFREMKSTDADSTDMPSVDAPETPTCPRCGGNVDGDGVCLECGIELDV